MIKKMKEGEKAGGNPEEKRTGDIVISCTCFLQPSSSFPLQTHADYPSKPLVAASAQ